jgi:hypothetical protein
MERSDLVTQHRQYRPWRVTVDSLFAEQDFVPTSLKKAQIEPGSSTGCRTPIALSATESPLPAGNALACWKARD